MSQASDDGTWAAERERGAELERSATGSRELLQAAEESRRALLSILEDQQRAEAAQRESREALRLTLAAAHIGHWELNLVTQVATRSPQHDQIFGYEEPVSDWGYEKFLTHVHPEDRERVNRLFQAGVAAKSEWDLECRINRCDGALRWIWVHGNVFTDAAGQGTRMLGMVSDITERKAAEEALKEAVRFSQSTIDALSAHLCVLNEEGVILATNRAWDEFAQGNPPVTRAVRAGANYLNVCDAAYGTEAAEGRAFAGGIRAVIEGTLEQFALEYPCHSPTETRWFTGRVTRFPSQGATRVVVVHENITDRKLAERALQESEARFRTMANTIPQLAWIARGDGFIQWYNERWYEYTGTTSQEMEGWGWQRVHDPEVLPMVLERWREAIERGASMEMEFPLRGADGRFRTFLTRVHPWKDATGNVVQWFGTNTDIEALKQSEEKVHKLNAQLEERVAERTAQLEEANAELHASRAELRSLFESLPGLYLVLTTDFHVVAVSDAYLKATMTTREGILDRNLFDIFPENLATTSAEGASQVRASLNRVLKHAAPDTMAIQRYDIPTADGQFEERYWSPVHSPVFDSNRKIKYIVHRVEEVTDFVRSRAQFREESDSSELSKRLERMEVEVFQSSQALQATNRELEAANRRLEIATQHKSEFLAGMSHELRTPLNAILGFTGTLLMKLPGPLNTDQEKQLRTVQTSAKHLLSLINDLLDLAKIEAGKREVVAEMLTGQSVLQDVASTLRPLAEKKGLRFEIEAPAADISLQTDRRALSQILFNLAGNAIKFTAQGCVTLSLDTRCEAHRTFVNFRVIDTGPGIPPEVRARLFGLFAQGQGREGRYVEGSGLGLHLSQNLAGLLGGHIALESTPAEGSTFTLTLPTVHAEEGVR